MHNKGLLFFSQMKKQYIADALNVILKNDTTKLIILDAFMQSRV
jgi:hypothetical protein